MEQTTHTTTVRPNAWARESVSLKLVLMGALALALMIPAALIGDLIRERENRRAQAISEVGSKWGEPQLLAGPILHVPYQHHWVDEKGKMHTSTSTAHFLPETLHVKGKVNSELRYRGIFEAVLYTTSLGVEGTFTHPRFQDWQIKPEDVLWDRAFVTVGITDGRGIREEILLNWHGTEIEMRSLGGNEGGIQASVSANVSLDAQGTKPSYPFSFNLVLNGHNFLKVLPVGKTTSIQLSGDWPNPSFQGAFLPEEREVNTEGFNASWKVLDLNRPFPQQWRDESYDFYSSSFGLELLVPVDGYQKTTRAQKYALMFISLTFLVLLFAELVKKRAVHPFQYVLIGLAICLFYLLLLSLSEHLAFNLSYLIAGTAITIMLTLYSAQVFKSREFGTTIGAYFASLYSYLFVLLQLNDYALLVGSIGLFIALSGVMYFSGRINWYPEPRLPQPSAA